MTPVSGQDRLCAGSTRRHGMEERLEKSFLRRADNQSGIQGTIDLATFAAVLFLAAKLF